MTTRLDPNSFTNHPSGTGAGSGLRANIPKGSLHGDSFEVADTAKTLVDSAEEISLHLAEKVEKRIKVGGRPAAATTARCLQYIQRIQEIEKIDNHTLRERMLDAVLRKGRPPLLAAREASGSASPTVHYALLQLALKEATEGNAGAGRIADIAEAIVDLEVDFGHRIRADLNTFETAAAYADSPEQFRSAQESFARLTHLSVLGKRTLAETLNVVLQRLTGTKGEKMSQGFKFLLEAAGQDAGASGPSTDPVLLETLIGDIYQLTAINTTLERCRQVLTTTQRLRAQVA